MTIFENSVFTPVKAMDNYLKMRLESGASPWSPLFVEDDNNCSPLSRATFIFLLRELLERIGYETNQLCCHSFRIGAATSAASSGVGSVRRFNKR